jgi:hypothetical protein
MTAKENCVYENTAQLIHTILFIEEKFFELDL